MLKFNGICHGGVWMERKSFVCLIQLFALLKVSKNYLTHRFKKSKTCLTRNLSDLEEQDELTKAYKTFACLFKPGTVAPVGEAYRLYKIAYGYDLFTDLYRPDGSYPSLQVKLMLKSVLN